VKFFIKSNMTSKISNELIPFISYGVDISPTYSCNHLLVLSTPCALELSLNQTIADISYYNNYYLSLRVFTIPFEFLIDIFSYTLQ